jgi:hypothetical protein
MDFFNVKILSLEFSKQLTLNFNVLIVDGLVCSEVGDGLSLWWQQLLE